MLLMSAWQIQRFPPVNNHLDSIEEKLSEPVSTHRFPLLALCGKLTLSLEAMDHQRKGNCHKTKL